MLLEGCLTLNLHGHAWDEEEESAVHCAVIGQLMVVERQARESNDPGVIAQLLKTIAVLEKVEQGFSDITLPRASGERSTPARGSKRAPAGNR